MSADFVKSVTLIALLDYDIGPAPMNWSVQEKIKDAAKFGGSSY